MVPRHARNRNHNASLDDARLNHALRIAAVAAILSDPKGAEALLDLADAEVGRLFKISLAQVMGVATVFNLDLRSIRQEGEKLRGRANPRTTRRTSARYSLVAEGKLLRAEVFCEARGSSEQRLRKDVDGSRIFSVEVDGDQYYPAFFLAPELDRKDLREIVRRLDGLSGWKKWRFFTEPKVSLENLTPLQVIRDREVKQVLQAATSYAEQPENVFEKHRFPTKR